MRLWSLHPKYLDAKGLVALWREGLLAQKVLQGQTKGYIHHPQLIRFRNTNNALGAIAAYLRIVADEADKRGYAFNRNKISKKRYKGKITVTSGQLAYEFEHLKYKLEKRSPAWLSRLEAADHIAPNPVFKIVNGQVENWEVIL